MSFVERKLLVAAGRYRRTDRGPRLSRPRRYAGAAGRAGTGHAGCVAGGTHADRCAGGVTRVMRAADLANSRSRKSAVAIA